LITPKQYITGNVLPEGQGASIWLQSIRSLRWILQGGSIEQVGELASLDLVTSREAIDIRPNIVGLSTSSFFGPRFCGFLSLSSKVLEHPHHVPLHMHLLGAFIGGEGIPGAGGTREHDHHTLEWIKNQGDTKVVYVGFGTQLRLDQAMIDGVIRISRLLEAEDVSVVWSLGSESYDHMEQPPPNLKMVSWTSQGAILKLKRTKLFVSHCGFNSVVEATRRAVPLLCVPFFSDQLENGLRVQTRGLGVSFRTKLEPATAPGLVSEIMKLLQDEALYARCLVASQVMRSEGGVDTAVRIVESSMNGDSQCGLASSYFRFMEAQPDTCFLLALPTLVLISLFLAALLMVTIFRIRRD